MTTPTNEDAQNKPLKIILCVNCGKQIAAVCAEFLGKHSWGYICTQCREKGDFTEGVMGRLKSEQLEEKFAMHRDLKARQSLVPRQAERMV